VIAFLARRLIQSVITLLIVSIVVFTIVQIAPGDPAIIANEETNRELSDQFAENLGLNDPIPVQYARWLGGVVRLDFGLSLQHSVPNIDLVMSRLPASLLLAGTSMVLATSVALTLGIVSAIKRHSLWDHSATVVAFLGLSVPGFWLGIMMVIVFSVGLGWLPSSGMTSPNDGSLADRIRHLIMPATVLATFAIAELSRYTRSSMVEVLRNDYVRTARAKGLKEKQVIWRHALRNALIPVVTVLAVTTPRVMGGAVVTETVFSWPGMGRLAAGAAFTRDYPLVMAVTMVVAVLVLLGSLVADLCYGILDPRVKLT
jgi:peptide/nickel transport system permease protein